MSRPAQVVRLWKGDKEARKQKKADEVVSNFAQILRRKALKTKLAKQKEACVARARGTARARVGKCACVPLPTRRGGAVRSFEARQKELKEALRLERSRTSTMREQLDQVDVLRKQCMQLAMKVDREANEVSTVGWGRTRPSDGTG